MHGHDRHNTTIFSVIYNMLSTSFGQYYFWPSSCWIQLSEKTTLYTTWYSIAISVGVSRDGRALVKKQVQSKEHHITTSKFTKHPMSPHYTFASLDITNIYSNIPIIKINTILTDTLKYYQTGPKPQKEHLMWYDVITRQNNFTHNSDITSHYDGLAMGAPSSGLLAELFLQHT